MTDENRCEPGPEWRFRKKPVVIEAFQLGVKWPEWWHEKHITNEVTTHNADGRHRGGPDYALIHTLEGVMRAEKGDWIIRGVRGEIYPCKPDIFALTYEAVSDLAPVTPPATVAALVEALKWYALDYDHHKGRSQWDGGTKARQVLALYRETRHERGDGGDADISARCHI